ncbi:MAG: NAD(P)-dependent oxidoreductase [Desulfobacterales bacterium]|nr:NAD(P)-dependent oxidoreductase [Desulfobacterales bacterium]
MKSVMITGGAGYVGSILVRELLREGYRVACIDNLRFGGESLIDVWGNPNFKFFKYDVTNYNDIDSIMDSHDFFAVIHLAAIVGDPACKMEPGLAQKTNLDASVHLLEKSMELDVPRFVFASTCSNYGKMEDSAGYLDENSPLAPVSLYAQLKVKFEDMILNEVDKKESFSPTSLRFATVYGISPRMRFDLTVNEFAKELAMGKELIIFGEQFWRPYCHVRDFSSAMLTVLNSHREKVAYNVFNVGDTSENYTKKMIADELLRQLPEGRIKYVQKDEDPRDYRVRFDKIKNELGFRISKTVPEGIKDVTESIRLGIIHNPNDQRYYNIQL